MLGIKNTNLDPVLVKVLPSGIAVYLSPFKDVYGSRLIFAGPHKSFTKKSNGKNTQMSNAVFLIRERLMEELKMESEERCYSIRTNEKLGLTVNPYPINREDIEDCSGETAEDFEESLDDHENLLSILEDQGNSCTVHNRTSQVSVFLHHVMDCGGNVDGAVEECSSPTRGTNTAQEEDQGNNPGSMHGIGKECNSPNRNSIVALD